MLLDRYSLITAASKIGSTLPLPRAAEVYSSVARIMGGGSLRSVAAMEMCVHDRVDPEGKLLRIMLRADQTLDRRRTQNQVGLLWAVAELGQVVDGVQAGPLIGQMRIQVTLFAVQRHRRPREGNPFAESRVNRARHEDGVLGDAVGFHTAGDDVDMQVDEAAHLDGPAEGDLAVALGEVQVTHREVRAVDEDRLEDSGPLGEVLDVLLAAVLPWWCGAGSLAATRVNSASLWEPRTAERQQWHPVRVGVDQRLLGTLGP